MTDQNGFVPIAEVLSDVFNQLEAMGERRQRIPGLIRWPFDDLNWITGGIRTGNLVILLFEASLPRPLVMANLVAPLALRGYRVEWRTATPESIANEFLRAAARGKKFRVSVSPLRLEPNWSKAEKPEILFFDVDASLGQSPIETVARLKAKAREMEIPILATFSAPDSREQLKRTADEVWEVKQKEWQGDAVTLLWCLAESRNAPAGPTARFVVRLDRGHMAPLAWRQKCFQFREEAW